MRLTPLTPIATSVVGVPATLFGFLPSWCLIVLVGVSVTLTAIPVVVTQIILTVAQIAAESRGQPARRSAKSTAQGRPNRHMRRVVDSTQRMPYTILVSV